MMSKIDIEYALLADGIRRFGNAAVRIRTEVLKIAENTENMDIFWDGEANEAYRRSLGEDLVAMGLVVSDLLDTVRILVNAYGIYLRAEEEIASQLKEKNRRI